MAPQLWDVDRGVLVAKLPTAFAGSSALAFSPDGKLLASADADAVVRLYDVPTGTLRSKHEDLLLEQFAVAFTPDSKTLVVGGGDRVIVPLDAATGKERRRLSTQRDPAIRRRRAWRRTHGNRLVLQRRSHERGQEHRAWDLQTGQSKVLTSGKGFASAALVPNGRLLLAAPEGNTVKLWAVH